MEATKSKPRPRSGGTPEDLPGIDGEYLHAITHNRVIRGRNDYSAGYVSQISPEMTPSTSTSSSLGMGLGGRGVQTPTMPDFHIQLSSPPEGFSFRLEPVPRRWREGGMVKR